VVTEIIDKVVKIFMEIVLNICISDGSEILVDGFDTLSFYNELPNLEIESIGYEWERNNYLDLLNNLKIYNFIGIQRSDPKDELVYRDHVFAFENDHAEKNSPIYLQTSSITTIIALGR
jgi:hypothetical protein